MTSKTCWTDEDISHRFDAYDDYLENLLGYTPLINDLEKRVPYERSILDYGCGGGKVSRRLKDAGYTNVTGVDISATMVAKSSSHPNSGGISFFQIQSGQIDTPDNSFDGAICCYVLINVHDKDEFDKILAEVFRVVKPGGVFYILNTNPNTTGVQFANFMNGLPGVDYDDGDVRDVVLKIPNEKDFRILDTHRRAETYTSSLRSVGFGAITSWELKLDDIDDDISYLSHQFDHEYTHAPFLMIRSTKPIA